jgi:hypothetical protein
MKTRMGILGALIATAIPAYAHHSQAEFDNSNVLEMNGEIVAAYWRNPHVNFTLRTVDENGNENLWEMEAGAWNSLSRRGVPKDAVRVGDQVTAAVYQSTKRPRQLHVNNVLLENGVEVILNAGGQPRWSTESYGGRDGAAAPALNSDTAADGGLYQIWSIAGGRRVPLDRELPLTPSAEAALAVWNPLTEDPLLKCTPPGMPPTMGNPYPMQFSQDNGNIVLHLEEFDNIRTIHLDARLDESAPSPLGHSVGRWEGDSLLVDTDNISYPYFNRVGVAQSELVRTSERFTVSADGRSLDYELTITDPLTLTDPVTWSTYYVSGRGEVIKPYECTVERYVE